MSFLKKIFLATKNRISNKQQTVEEMRNNPDLIQVFDEYDREMFIDRHNWKNNVLIGNINNSWNNPDELYNYIIMALNDGFAKDILKAAKRLYKIDSIQERAVCTLAIVLRNNNKSAKALKLLNDYLKTNEKSAYVLTNIAQAQLDLNQNDLAEKTVQQALEADPNNDVAVEICFAIKNESSGEGAAIKILKELAENKDSWMAKLYLGHHMSKNGDCEQSLKYYKEILNKLEEIPPDVLMSISGALGEAGRLQDAIDLCGSRFDAEKHGIEAGNNLIKACVELKDYEQAKSIISQLYKLNRPDWKQNLVYWEEQINQAVLDNQNPVDDSELSITTICIESPIWAHKLSLREALFQEKAKDAPVVSFMPFTCTYENPPEQIIAQQEDTTGIISRSFPLFLCEQVYMKTTAFSKMLVPVISGNGSFVLSGTQSSSEDYIANGKAVNADYIIGGNITQSNNDFILKAILIDIKSQKTLNEFDLAINFSKPGGGILKLSEKIIKALQKACNIENVENLISYQLPRHDLLNLYLGACSKSLAMSVSCAENNSSENLYEERGMLDTMLELAINDSFSDVAKLLFISGLAKNKAYGSDIYLEYQQKAKRVLQETQLAEPVAKSVKETMKDLYSNC